MALTVREARPLDFLEVTRRKREFGVMAHQLALSEALTVLSPADELVAIAGLFDGPDTAGVEAWFAAGPACARHLFALVRLLRQVLDEAAAMAPGLGVTLYEDPAGVAGARLARWLGFSEAGFTDSRIGRLRTWRRIL